MDMNLSKLQETVKRSEACSTAVHVVSKSRTRLSDWTELKRKRTASPKEYEILPADCLYIF